MLRHILMEQHNWQELKLFNGNTSKWIEGHCHPFDSEHSLYRSGHETVAVLLPGFAMIAKPGNKTATVSSPDPYTNCVQTNYNTNTVAIILYRLSE